MEDEADVAVGVAVVCCKHFFGEVCLAIWAVAEEIGVAAAVGVVAVSVEVAEVAVAALVVLAEVLEAAEVLAAGDQAEVGKGMSDMLQLVVI